MVNDEFILLKNLHRTYQEAGLEHAVLKGITLTIGRGETIALLGRSGSGKSTLLNVISGIDKLDQGRVIVNGVDLTVLPERESTLFRRKNIGFVYQFFNLIPTLTAVENIALVLELNGYSPSVVREKSRAMLTAVGLGQEADRFPDRMSGGEQQRVSLARAFINKPIILFVDEPTGNLDTETSEMVEHLLFQLNEEAGTTLILVTHDMDLARKTHRILRLKGGRIVDDIDNADA